MPRTYSFEQFAGFRRCLGPLCFSPDGHEIAYITDTQGQLDLWRQSFTDGVPRPITSLVEYSVRSAAWSPDGQTIAIMADRHGDEFSQVFLASTTAGGLRQVTSTPKTQHRIVSEAWSPDGRYLAYDANDRGDHSNTDVLVRDIVTGKTQRLLAGDAWYSFGGWSPDGAHIIAIEFKSTTDQRLHIVSSDGSQIFSVNIRGEAKTKPGSWAVDSSGFYFLTDFGREFIGIAFYEIRRKRWHWVERPPWDVENVAASCSGNYLAWVVNEDGRSKLYLRDLRSKIAFQVPDLSHGVIESITFSPTNDLLAVLMTSATRCSEIFVIKLPRRSCYRITDCMLGAVNDRKLVTPTLVRYRTRDGRKIPSWLYTPLTQGRSDKTPVVISVHGGPERQERPAYIYCGLYQYWTSRGIAVLAPNFRGSTGYGKTYQKLLHRDWGGAELVDIDYAVRYLAQLDWIDPSRIAIFGGSFGGFIVLSAISRLPYDWRAAVDIMGPSNLVRFVKAVPPHWRRHMARWIGDPKRDHDRLMATSPVTHVQQIRTPLLIVQGANDPRVARSESDALVKMLRARGVEVRYEVYDDEGHGFTKRANELKAWRDTAEFVERHLLSERGADIEAAD